MTDPAHGGEHRLGDLLAWETSEADREARDVVTDILITTEDGTRLVHAVHLVPDTTEVVVPALPSAVDPARVYGRRARGVVQLFDVDFEAGLSRRWTASWPFAVLP